jgi:C-terminal processing protease CtpA/Prc
MRVDHAHLQVVAVNAGSPAACAGIQRGDRIDRVDGTAVRHLDLAAIRAHLHGRPGSRLRVHLIDAAGHGREVTLRLEAGH